MALLPHHGRATRHSLTASHVTPHEAISPRRWRRVAAGVARCDRVRTVEVTIWTTTTTTTMFSVSLQLMTWENINPGNCILCLLCSIAAPQNRCMKTWRHPQNRKYITYRNASRGKRRHDQMQHAQKIREVRPCGFRVMQADRQTSKQTYSSQYFAPYTVLRSSRLGRGTLLPIPHPSTPSVSRPPFLTTFHKLPPPLHGFIPYATARYAVVQT